MSEIVLTVLLWLAAATLLFIFIFIGSVTAFYWLHGYFSECYKNIPQFKIWPIYTYVNILRMVYRGKYPRAFILQIMFCYCRFFERKGISIMWMGLRPVIYFNKPEKLESLLNNSVTITKSVEYDFLKTWLGTGLLTSSGNKWRSHRKLLTQAFHFRILEDFLSAFNEQSAILSKKLEAVVAKPWIDIGPMISKFALDTICQTTMGVRLKTQSGSCQEYMESIEEISDIFMYRILRPWLWCDPIFLYLFPSGRRFRKNVKRIHDFTWKVIKMKKEYMIKQINEERSEGIDKVGKKAFLELLLEHHLKDDSFTEEHIREEVDTFMFEGHDTTSMALCWILYEIGRHPEIEEKVYQELAVVFECDTEREVTSDDFKDMKYLERTIKEGLRLHPSVPFIARQLKKDLKIDDYTLRPGCSCFVPIVAVHMDPEQFPVPEKFDPDRFLPENNNKRHPYAFIPFSAGPRNCIGQKFALMELKTVLVHILRKFKITSIDPQDKISSMAGLVLKNAEPLRVRFELRDAEDF